MESHSRFTGKKTGAVSESINDTDLTHNSPHHTIGKGATQAAAGNHKHTGADIESGTIPRSQLPYKIGRVGPYPVGANASSANIVITHGLGILPIAVFVSVDGDTGDCDVFASVESFNATTILAQIRSVGSAEAAVYLNWIAFA